MKDVMKGFAIGLDGSKMNILDLAFPSVTCKIDFINPLLGNEFLNIVERWHKARSESLPNAGWLEFMVKRKQSVVTLIRYLIFTLVIIFSCSLLHYLLQKIGLNELLKVQHIEIVMFWLIGTGLLIALTSKVVSKLSDTIVDSLSGISHSTMFNMTRGDENKRKKIEKENNANKVKVVWNLAASIVIKIIVGVGASWLLTLTGI
jgi:energy-coupling factor transporter transmembrane protein EcfT